MQSKSLLIIGGTGFFGKSILDYFKKNNDSPILNKIIIFSRGIKNIKIDKTLKRKIKIIKISGNIHKIKKLPAADYVIYAAILKNYNQDIKAVKNYLSLAVKYHLNSKILYISSGAVYGIQKLKIKKLKENHLVKYKKLHFKNGYKKNY
jgi:nucleoside-diphosphate-sugar epimerase